MSGGIVSIANFLAIKKKGGGVPRTAQRQRKARIILKKSNRARIWSLLKGVLYTVKINLSDP